jgi:hypothetical protein
MRDTRGSAFRRNPGLNDEIPLGFPKGRPPIIPEVSGGHIPHNSVEISGGNNPKNYVGDGSIIDATFPIRGSPKARQSFSPMVAALAATLGMGIAEIATLKALHQWTTPITSTTHAFAPASECAVLANAPIILCVVDNARALDATPLGLATVLNARYPG